MPNETAIRWRTSELLLRAASEPGTAGIRGLVRHSSRNHARGASGSRCHVLSTLLTAKRTSVDWLKIETSQVHGQVRTFLHQCRWEANHHETASCHVSGVSADRARLCPTRNPGGLGG